jgi:hypothetical protein
MIETRDNVKASLLIAGSGDDDLLNWLMDAAAGYVRDLTGRDFDGGTFTELHPAGRATLFLRNFPVTSVTSVKVDAARLFGVETARPADSYVLHADRGVIESLAGPFLAPRGRDDWPAAVQVVYATATGAPAAVKEAFAQLVGHWYRQAKTFSDQEYQMLLERDGGTSAKTWSWSLTRGLTLPPGVRELLEPYRVPPV